MELVMQAKISRVHGFGLGQSKFFVDFKYSEQAIYFTVSKNGISGRRKCNTTNCIIYELASKKDHFDEKKTIISRKNKKIFDILCFHIFSNK